MISKLHTTVYAFGSQCDTIYGKMVFKPDGSIYGYSHPNESSWKMEGDELLLLSENGHISRRFRSDGMNNWFGHAEGQKWPFFLVEVISIEPNNNPLNYPSFFINSIPKSGTYFLESALSSLSISSIRLHASGLSTIDDNRNLNDEQMHKDPWNVRLSCPIELVTSLLNGSQMVGHVEYQHVIQEIKKQNVCVLSTIRNLRDVVVSLYKFKLYKVNCSDIGESFWKSLPEEKRFEAFLTYYHEKDLEHIREMSSMMIKDHTTIFLRYEDMVNGLIVPETAEMLNNYYPNFADKLSQALLNQCGQQTPTYSGERSDWKKVWNENIEEYFVKSGMYELNKQLEYEEEYRD